MRPFLTHYLTVRMCWPQSAGSSQASCQLVDRLTGPAGGALFVRDAPKFASLALLKVTRGGADGRIVWVYPAPVALLCPAAMDVRLPAPEARLGQQLKSAAVPGS